MRPTKKVLLLLCSPSKCSFTLSKLRFLGVRTPKNNPFIQPRNKKWITHLLLSHPHLFGNISTYARKYSIEVLLKNFLLSRLHA